MNEPKNKSYLLSVENELGYYAMTVETSSLNDLKNDVENTLNNNLPMLLNDRESGTVKIIPTNLLHNSVITIKPAPPGE